MFLPSAELRFFANGGRAWTKICSGHLITMIQSHELFDTRIPEIMWVTGYRRKNSRTLTQYREILNGERPIIGKNVNRVLFLSEIFKIWFDVQVINDSESETLVIRWIFLPSVTLIKMRGKFDVYSYLCQELCVIKLHIAHLKLWPNLLVICSVPSRLWFYFTFTQGRSIPWLIHNFIIWW